MTLSDVASWAQIIWFAAVTVGAIYASIKFWIKLQNKLEAMDSKMENMGNYTYKRNGGGSIADSLARIEARNERQDVAMAENTRLTLETVKSLAKLEGRFNNHIEEGAK